jgi:NADP-dependent 3-hydroxy acid dehydrogenase YdfG
VGVDGAMSATAAHGVAEAVRFTLRKMHGERVADAAVRPVPAAQDETAESRERRESRGRATALAAQSLLDISEITRVVDVILEDDRDVAVARLCICRMFSDNKYSVQVSVCMGTELTIGTARDVCVKVGPRFSIHTLIIRD